MLVDETEAGAENYSLCFHSYTGPDGTGTSHSTHTGTSHTILQDP